MTRTVAVIGGTGALGAALALRWTRAGEQVVIGSRELERAQNAAASIAAKEPAAPRPLGMLNSDALGVADVVVLTVPFLAHARTINNIRSAFRPGTILIDTTVPLAAAIGGSASKPLGIWQGSAAQQAAELSPREVLVAAAFHHVSAKALAAEREVDCDVIVCSDSETARTAACELAEKIPGVRAVNGGKLENARILEQITALLVGMNYRYKVHSAGLRLTGLPLAAPRIS